MRTLIFLVVIFVSSTMSAQIPDFNTNLKSNVPPQINVLGENIAGYTSENMIKVPQELQDSMKTYFKIQGDHIDKFSAKEFARINQAEIKTIEEKRDCAKILVKGEDKGNPCFMPLEKYSTTMVNYLTELEKRKKIDEFLTSVYVEAPKSEPTYDKGITTVSIPARLQNDMKLLMGISGDELDAFVAAEYWTTTNKKVDSLTKKRNEIKFNTSESGRLMVDYNDTYKKYSDSIQRYRVLRSFFRTANTLGGNPKLFWTRFFPVKNTMSARYFFLDNNDEANVMLINKVGIQTDFSSSYSANANLITGVLFPFKFTMATNISQQTSDEDQIAANKLPNGGLWNVSMLMPILFSKSYVGNGKKIIFYVPVEYRFNIDNVEDKIAFNDTYNYHEASTYFMGTFDLLQKDSDTDVASLFGALKFSYFNGNSQFGAKLLTNKFWTANLTLGIQIRDKYTVSANIPLGADDDIIRKQQVATIGLTFQPSNKN